MDKTWKTKWLKALRSGKYRQTREKLKSRNGAFCCLGVLCDLYGVAWDYDEDGDYWALDSFTELPDQIARKVNISRESQHELACMNDGMAGQRRHNFQEIADYIEQEL